MYLLYLDEFGHGGAWDPSNPRYRHHPLFGLAGFAVRGERWRDADRGYLREKLAFYRNEISRKMTLEGVRPERFEPKSLRDRRDRRFGLKVLDLLERCEARIFAYGCAKQIGVAKHNETVLYTTTVQGILRQFEKFLRRAGGKSLGRGIVILDQRQETLNEIVLASSQSYLFSKTIGFDRLIETPLLVPSEWYHGVQCADTISRIIAAVHRWRILDDPTFEWAESLYGPHLGRLTASYEPWSSIYVQDLRGQ